MLLQEDLFGLIFWHVGYLGDDEQLLDEGQSLLLPLVHEVLLRPAPEYPLQEEDGDLPLAEVPPSAGVLLDGVHLQVDGRAHDVEVLVVADVGGGWTGDHVTQVLDVDAHHLVLLVLGF